MPFLRRINQWLLKRLQIAREPGGAYFEDWQLFVEMDLSHLRGNEYAAVAEHAGITANTMAHDLIRAPQARCFY